VGCSGNGLSAFSIIIAGTISLQTFIHEETDGLEHETRAFPETSMVYPEMLNE
jgi:hypothetical protein